MSSSISLPVRVRTLSLCVSGREGGGFGSGEDGLDVHGDGVDGGAVEWGGDVGGGVGCCVGFSSRDEGLCS